MAKLSHKSWPAWRPLPKCLDKTVPVTDQNEFRHMLVETARQNFNIKLRDEIEKRFCDI